MTPAPPRIDDRSSDELARETEALLRRYLDLAPSAPVPGTALVHLFARLAELVVERLNRVPEKNFLAFLDLIGVSPLPPQPARVPLTFSLVAGAAEAIVPARSPVAALPLAGEDEPPTFETERDLVVTRSQLVAAYAREPARDLVADVSERALGRADGSFAAFEGEQPIEHALYLGSASFALGPAKTIVVEIDGREGEAPWLHAVEWSFWDGAGWAPLAAPLVSTVSATRRRVTFGDVPAIPPTAVGDVISSWVRATLRTSLPHAELEPAEDGGPGRLRQRELAPDAAFSGGVRLAPGRTLHPFGEAVAREAFYLGCERAFSKPAAAVEIDVRVEEGLAVEPTGDLELVWEYWSGAEWQWLATTRPGPETEVDRAPGSEFDDGTEAFTTSGRISFVTPADWAPREHGGVTTHWLRARVAEGEYGTPRPALVRLLIEYSWLVPYAVGVETSVKIERDALRPEAAFANEVPVDIGKDFLPFGAEPGFNDTLHLAAEPFSQPGAVVTLEVALSNPGDDKATPAPAAASQDLVLRWEHWNGDKGVWETLGESGRGASAAAANLQDATAAFTKNGKVTFTVPEGSAPREVNGRPASWIRVRIVRGDYGQGATYSLRNPSQPNEGYVVVPASFRPPSVRSLAVSYRFESAPAAPDAIVTENDFRLAARAAPLAPFVPPADVHPALYLGFEHAAEATAFANRPAALFLSVVPALYEPGERSTERARPLVSWEYWNGARWARLAVTDETRAFARRGVVGFVGPADLRASTEFGRAAFWLRARAEGGRFAAPPHLARVLTNTVWAGHAVRIAGEVLGTSTGEPGQTFATARAPVLPGQRVEVRETALPAPGGRAAVAAPAEARPDGGTPGAAGGSAEAWVRWDEVPDFHGSGPRSRHYVLDRLTGRVRFGDGRRGLAPPAGRANVRATYETGGGSVGNRPRGSVAQLKAAVPYVDAVTNPEPAEGGADAEPYESVLERGPKVLRHRNRALAVADVEDLAFEASPDVARARAVPARGSAEAGRFGVVVVPRSAEPQPVPSVELLNRVEDAVRARMPATAGVWVAGPGWVRMSVTAEIVPVSLDEATNVETVVLARLAAFLHPLTGGAAGEGWDFGRRPYRSDVFALVEGLPGVDHVRTLSLVEAETHESPAAGAFLVYSGAHRLTLAGRDA